MEHSRKHLVRLRENEKSPKNSAKKKNMKITNRMTEVGLSYYLI